METIKCYRHGNNLVFFCRYCNKEHKHGLMEGHRVAHCGYDKESPYRTDGYILVEDKLSPLTE